MGTANQPMVHYSLTALPGSPPPQRPLPLVRSCSGDTRSCQSVQRLNPGTFTLALAYGFGALIWRPSSPSSKRCVLQHLQGRGLGERRLCTAEVRGSNPLGFTRKSACLQEKYEERKEAPDLLGAIVQQPCSNTKGSCDGNCQGLL